MFGRRRKEIDEKLVAFEHQLDLIYTALIIRDPGTAKSAEAFEGLRKQVIAGATSRHAHVAQLAEFDVALHRGARTSDLLSLTGQWLDQAGVSRIEDPTHREAFEGTVPPGVEAEVEIPAYVNTLTGQLVRQGRLRERAILARDEAKPGAVSGSSIPIDDTLDTPSADDTNSPKADPTPISATSSGTGPDQPVEDSETPEVN